MTRKLEELFDLPTNACDSEHDAPVDVPATKQEIVAIDDAIDKIDAALPGVKGLESSDDEIDELAKKASETFDDLMDLGMNVEARFSAPIFEASAKMLATAVTAKLGKVQKKLKQTEIALKARKLEHDINKDSNNDDGELVSAQVFDRNELLKTIRKQ